LSYPEQLQALRFIAAGEDMRLLEAVSITAPNGYVMDLPASTPPWSGTAW
jgi:hypothetical protein